MDLFDASALSEGMRVDELALRLVHAVQRERGKKGRCRLNNNNTIIRLIDDPWVR